MQKKQIENRTSLEVVMVIGSVCLLILLLDTQVLSIVFNVECRAVINT